MINNKNENEILNEEESDTFNPDTTHTNNLFSKKAPYKQFVESDEDNDGDNDGSDDEESNAKPLITTRPKRSDKETNEMRDQERRDRVKTVANRMSKFSSTSSTSSSRPLVLIKLNDEECMPIRMTKYSVGYDLFSTTTIVIPARSSAIILTGVKILNLPNECEAQIRPRSSTILKKNLLVMLGTIDPDYKGELGIVVYNLSDTDQVCEPKERLAQLCFASYLSPELLTDEEEYKARKAAMRSNDRPRPSFGGERRPYSRDSSGGRPSFRRSFDGPRSDDRPKRSFDGPRNDDRPKRSFDGPRNDDRPKRSFDGPRNDDRPKRSFEESDSSTFTSNPNRSSFRSERSGFKGGFGERSGRSSGFGGRRPRENSESRGGYERQVRGERGFGSTGSKGSSRY